MISFPEDFSNQKRIFRSWGEKLLKRKFQIIWIEFEWLGERNRDQEDLSQTFSFQPPISFKIVEYPILRNFFSLKLLLFFIPFMWYPGSETIPLC